MKKLLKSEKQWKSFLDLNYREIEKMARRLGLRPEQARAIGRTKSKKSIRSAKKAKADAGEGDARAKPKRVAGNGQSMKARKKSSKSFRKKGLLTGKKSASNLETKRVSAKKKKQSRFSPKQADSQPPKEFNLIDPDALGARPRLRVSGSVGLESEWTQEALAGLATGGGTRQARVTKKGNILIIRELAGGARRGEQVPLSTSQVSQLETEWEDVSPNVPELLEKERIKILAECLGSGESRLLGEMNRQILRLFDRMRDAKWTLQNQLDYQRAKADAYRGKYQVDSAGGM